jgi:Ca2+-transporting ATPase
MSKKSKKARKASKSPEVPLRSLDASEVVINFLVNAPLGMALGMDKQAPGLMSLRPRSRDATIMTKGLLTTAGLVGLFMAVCTLALISYGTNHFDSLAIGSSMGLTAFSLLIIVAAYQARSVTATAFTVETVDNRNLNWTAVAELVPAVLLVFIWELGKLIARRVTSPAAAVIPAAGHS